MTDIFSDFRELSKTTSMNRSDNTLEEALKPQQGVLCMRNSDRGLVKTSNFGILVKRDRKAFNLDFVNVDIKPIKFSALNLNKIAEIKNVEFSKDFCVDEQEKGENFKTNTERIQTEQIEQQQNTEQILKQLDSNMSSFNQSDATTLIKHSSVRKFIRKEGEISAVTGINHPRITIGKCVKASRDGKLIIQSFDTKLPKIKVPKRSLICLDSDLAHVVTINDWPEDSDFANGKILETLQVSNLDYDFVLTKNLILNEIETRNYSQEFENSVLIRTAVDERDFAERLDLRHETVFTIDPKEAEDLDDALSCKQLQDGSYEIGVHIADVSHFVKPNTNIDEMARRRNSSIYLHQKFIPMLPLTLSRDVCSLLPGKDRLAISLIFNVNKEGIVFKELYRLSVINSVRKFSYEEAEKVITASKNKKYDQSPECIAIRLLHKLSRILRNIRIHSNAFILQKELLKFKVEKSDDDIDVTEVKETRKQSEMLVEEMMILANSRVASHLLKRYPYSTLLRVQPPIPDKFLFNLQILCNETINLNTSNMKELQKSIVDILDDRNLHDKEIIVNMLIHLVQKSNRRAKYVCSGSNRNVSMLHSSLNTTYTHFTSPIRRYADIVVHRLLKRALQEESSDTEINDNKVDMIAELCNSRRNSIKKVIKKCNNFLMQLYIAKYGPFTESCAVVAIHKTYFSVFVKRFSLVAKIKYAEIDRIQNFSIITRNKKPGLFRAVLQFAENNVTLEPLSILPITLRCNANEEKQCFELTITM